MKITEAMMDKMTVNVAIHAAKTQSQPVWVQYSLSDIGELSLDQTEVWCMISSDLVVSEIEAANPDKDKFSIASIDWVEDSSESNYQDSDDVYNRLIQQDSSVIGLVNARGPVTGSG